MMKEAVALATASVLLLLSALHLYWAAGGEWGKGVTVPQRDGQPLFRPSKKATIAVAVLLALAAGIVVAGLKAGDWVLAFVFGLRAVGDCRWVGLLKRVRGTPFARLDTFVYSPLCLALCLGCLYMVVRR
jgi:hypothetical protein